MAWPGNNTGGGAPGVDGKTVRNGAGAPSAGLGVDGDFYIRTSDWTIYGPKTAGAWGSPTPLVGAPGLPGLPGTPGAPGPTDGNGDKAFMHPPGLHAANLTAVTVLATNTARAVYLGRARKANPTFDVVLRVTTLAATITWAEVAIATGTPVANGNPALTTRGFTSVAATFNTTGIKKTTVTTTGINPGDDVWLLVGSQATTPFQVRGMLADDLQSGVHASAAARPSTMGAGTSFAVAAATLAPPWATVRQN